MSNNDKSSKNKNNDVASSSFPFLKPLEVEDIAIRENLTNDDGSNVTANDEGRSINAHKKDYFMSDAKHTGMARSFKHASLVS